MERTTLRGPDGTAYIKSSVTRREAAHRLAAYEDTGLEPEEIEQLKGEVFGLRLDKRELEQAKRERDAAVEFLESAIRYSANPCEGCKADCIDAGSDAAERVDQCGAFEWRSPKED